MVGRAEIARAVNLIELAGVQHAPDGRYVDCYTPPGVYYLTSEDVGIEDILVQVLWVDVSQHGLGRISARRLADMVGWQVREEPHELPGENNPVPVTVISAIIGPAARG